MVRGRPSLGTVTIALVLHLAPAALAVGRIAGEAEIVQTGARALVRDVDELVAFLRRHMPELEPNTREEDDAA